MTWLTAFRAVTITLLLATIGLRLLSTPGAELSTEDAFAFRVIAAVYLLTVAYALVLRSGRVGPGAAYLQVLGDVLLATCLVYLTGGAESPFTFTYSLAVVAGSILLFARGAMIAAAASSLAFGALIAALTLGLLHPASGTVRLEMPRLFFVLSSNVLAQFLIAALASYLARQLSMKGGQLSEREADLRALAALHSQILAGMPSGLLTCDLSGRVTFVNKAAAVILGIDERTGELRIQELIPAALELGPSNRRLETEVDTRLGRRTLGLSITAMEARENLLIIFQDLTELRRAESELRRVDHLAALGSFAAQLAHEIRNPLASMRGCAQMIAEEAPPDGSTAKMARIVLRESDRLSQLVADFLRFARPPPPVRRPLFLDALVREIFELVKADPMASGIKLTVELVTVECDVDPDQLKQVLLNLLRNALAAVGRGGEVKVSIGRGTEAAEVRVWDSAGAIPKENLARIFEPFFTTREGGTGLGLSTAHAIVQAHGGTIRVASSPQAGTEFSVALPLRHEAALGNPGR